MTKIELFDGYYAAMTKRGYRPSGFVPMRKEGGSERELVTWRNASGDVVRFIESRSPSVSGDVKGELIGVYLLQTIRPYPHSEHDIDRLFVTDALTT